MMTRFISGVLSVLLLTVSVQAQPLQESRQVSAVRTDYLPAVAPSTTSSPSAINRSMLGVSSFGQPLRPVFEERTSLSPGNGMHSQEAVALPEKQLSTATPADQQPRQPTAAETFFAQPFPVIGDAVGGSKEAEKEVESPSDAMLAQEEQSRQEDFLFLLNSDQTLPTEVKTRIFLRLNKEQRRQYLQQLPVSDRQMFLRSLGEKEYWYAEDLKGPEVNLALRQFGLDFFAREQAGFVVDEQALVGPDYIIGPGDILEITVWGGIEGQYQVKVGRNGEITIPQVGAISLWGQSFAQAKETIRSGIGKYFKNFELNVSMGPLRSLQVFVVGEVETPGSYTVSSLATVLTTLAAAGGPTGNGSLRNVQLRRGGNSIATIDFYDFFLKGDKSQDVRLQSGDTLFVPVVGPLVGVAGDVRRPGIYELTGNESLDDALTMAGGPAATAFLGKVSIERVDTVNLRKVVVDVDLRKDPQAAKMALQDRDLVKIVSMSSMTGQYVRLKGHVARPGIYQLTAEMRLSDLFSHYDNLLPGYYPGLVEILRLEPPEYRPARLTVRLDKALAGEPKDDVVLQEYDEVRIFSLQEMEEIPEVTVSGAVLKPGSVRLYESMTVRDLVAAAGNLQRKAYLDEAEITRFVSDGRNTHTERLLINLSKALQGDPLHNPVLESDDHLFVRSIPDFADKQLVDIKGEVLFPGNYAIAKGETLASVIERAGGYTNKAYLRGALFTRESLKEEQQEQIDKLIAEQEQEINRVSAEISQLALGAEERAAASALLANRTSMLKSLRQTKALGRMVVQLRPLESFRGSASDVELINGDSVEIPQSPQTVSVFGQVYSPAALVYQPGKTVGYYLAQVGGPKRTANEDEIFVVRANGSVLSAAQGGWGIRWDSDSRRWVAGGFNATELYPGDTVLVPEQVEKLAVMRNVKDISTIFYQMALGAAAIASF